MASPSGICYFRKPIQILQARFEYMENVGKHPHPMDAIKGGESAKSALGLSNDGVGEDLQLKNFLLQYSMETFTIRDSAYVIPAYII